MPRRTVAEVLACFEEEFASAASAFTRGEYALWLGSGISREVVPGVDQLLRGLLSFLQHQIDPSDSKCRFSAALSEIVDLAKVSAAERDQIDFTRPVEAWPALPQLIDSLVDKYSAVLDVRVDGEDPDYLVWEGISAASTYGAAHLLPDVEHLCVAILMLEGVVRFVPTTNWDGLVEGAVSRLASHPDTLLRVVVLPEDFASEERPVELVKFHGCAVRALANEERYRDRLIAREAQISGWAAKPENLIMKNRLEFVLASKPAFVVGLSAQDANIHAMFNQASRNLVRAWPVTPPAMVCATEQLGRHHKHMLKVIYGDTGFSSSKAEVEASALLGAYAKPALVALVLQVLTEKLCCLLESVSDLGLAEPERGVLKGDIRSLRDVVGSTAEADIHTFTNRLIITLRWVLTIFRTGRASAVDAQHYEPLTVKPVAEALGDPNFPGDALGRLAVVAALVSRGHVAGDWTIGVEPAVARGDAMLRVTSTEGRTSEVFIVKDVGVLSKLEVSEEVDLSNSDVLIVCTESSPARMTRSPRTRYGRTGTSGAREVDLAALGAAATSTDELFESFKLEGAL